MNDFLLNLFTGTDKISPAIMFPNLENGIVYATDSYALVAIPENELALKYGTNEKYPNAHKILDDFQKKELKSIRVNVIDLAKELTKARIEVDKDSKFARIKLSMIEKEDGTQIAININDLYFHPFQLYRLFMVASLKRIDDFEILYDPNNYGQVVSVFGNIKVLTMLYTRTS